MCPAINIPNELQPGQTVALEFETHRVDEESEAFYSLVTPDGDPFGEIMTVTVIPTPKPKEEPVPKPQVVVIAAPNDDDDGGIPALQGELKHVEWHLANVGKVAWPEDTVVTLFYNTPGFDHLPCKVEIPQVGAGMTVHVGIQALMPEKEGKWKAMWAVTSPSTPDFGEVLFVEFKVDDFPFMEWMLTDEAKADTVSDVSSVVPETAMSSSASQQLPSMTVAFQQHVFQGSGEVDYQEDGEQDVLTSLGQVSKLAPGSQWLLELALSNDGEAAWPEDSAIACCFGTGFGCGQAQVGPVGPGETILIHLELDAPPQTPAQTAWVLATGETCFGPVMTLDVV